MNSASQKIRRRLVQMAAGVMAASLIVLGYSQPAQHADPLKTKLQLSPGLKKITTAKPASAVISSAAPSPRKIHLRSKTIDTTALPSWSPLKQGGGKTLVPSKGKQLFLVQFSHGIQRNDLAKLQKHDLAPVQYLPDNAYLVYGEPAKLPSGTEAPELVWSGALDRQEKLHPALQRQVASTQTQPTALEPVIVQYFDQAESAQTAAAVRALAKGAFRPFKVGNHFSAHVTVQSQDLEALAALPLVYNVEPQPKYQLHDERQALIVGTLDDATAKTVSPPVSGTYYSDFLSRKQIDGSGVVVEILDDGLDTGNASNAPGSAHPDFVGRIEGIENFTTDALASGVDGHGTLNASIIMGQPKAAATLIGGRWLGRMDDQGFQLGQGIAPGARILAGKVFSDMGNFDDAGLTFAEMLANGAAHHPQVCSNSWGADYLGEYNSDCSDFDALVRDADSNTAGDQGMTFCFSTGNSASMYVDPRGTIASPASAKNVIAVGATENSDGQGTDGCLQGASVSNDATKITRFSGRGPTQDGRMGVTLMAPGTHIYGAASMISTFNGSGVCGGPGNDGKLPNTDAYYPPGQTDYTWSSGTSHSCPAVAGGAALFCESYRKRFGANPSPAMVKAALVNSAAPIPGDLDHPTAPAPYIPNVDVGWGRLNLDGLLPDAGKSFPMFVADQDNVLTQTGQMKEYDITALNSSTPLKITLCWTDAPGFPDLYPSLVNDLDLRVLHGSDTYYGNVFTAGQSVTGGSADHYNNLECVYIAHPSGMYRVQVSAAMLNGDGVPAHAGVTDQDYALYATGGLNETPKGAIRFDRSIYGIVDSLRIHLTDSDLRGQASAPVTLTTSLPGQTLQVDLPVTFPGGGQFEGTVPLFGFDPPPAGQLYVMNGDTITGTYNDANDGSGSPAVATATAVVDGQPPTITNASFDNITASSARVTIDTDEATTLTATYGLTANAMNSEIDDNQASTHHVLALANLSGDTVYHFQARANDPVGNFTFSDVLAFKTERATCGAPYTMEGTPAPFTHQADVGVDNWTLANTPYAHSPSHVWYCSDTAVTTDSSLVLPGTAPLLPDATLYFWHTFGLETNYDGGVLEYSTDGAKTWSDLGPYIVSGGYNGLLRASGNPLSGRKAWSGGAAGTMTRVQVDLSFLAGKTVSFRFRLGSDNFQSTACDGWLIDDVQICSSAGSRGRISLNAPAYRAGQDLTVYLSDIDLDGQPSASVHIQSTSEPAGETISLQALGAGHFSASVPVTRDILPGDGQIGVANNDIITAVYTDQDDGTGTPNIATATATADLACVTLLSCEPTTVTSRAAYYTVKTNEVARIALKIHSTRDGKDTFASSPTPTKNYQALLTGLTPCSPHYITVTTTDTLGNSCSTTGLDARFRFITPNDSIVFNDTAELGGVPLLAHGADLGLDSWAIGIDGFAHSPTHSWQASDLPSIAEDWLITPKLTILPGDMLVFWHSYQFEQVGSLPCDGGMLQISTDGTQWVDMEAGFAYDTQYDGTLTTAFDNPMGGHRAFCGGTMGAMKPAFVNLDQWAGSGRYIRFLIASDSSGGNLGWHIDDVQILHQEECMDYSSAVSGKWRLYK